jgi:Zn-dependent M28 family amino/carboxypeptidase
MRRWIWICLALSASAEGIRYRALPTSVIAKRIGLARGSNSEREHTLSDLFTEAGCPADQLTEQPVKRSKAPNLICTMPGTLDSAIITGAHFDFVEAGAGVVDNWSGASLLPSLYESLKSEPRRHTFRFIAFTDEEKGLVGSAYYVSHLGKEERSKIHAMINLDSLGTGPTKLETDRGDRQLENALAAVALSLKLPLNVVNVHQVGMSDSDSFQDRKLPSINIHSITNETFRILHSSRDRLEAIHMDDYYESYRLIAAYLAYLDQTLDKD